MDTLLALIRALHLAGLMSVFGACALLLQLEPGEAAPRRWVLLWGAVLSVVTVLAQVLVAPGLTTVPIARAGVLTILALLCLRDGLILPKAILAGAALGLIAAESHAAKAGGASLLYAGIDALHLLAAAYWVGGLTILAPAAIATPRDLPRLIRLLHGFARWAAPSVGVLLVAGAANGFIILGAPGVHWTSRYVILLALKIVLAAIMVALALTNRLGVLPGLERGDREAEETIPLTIIAELSCAVAILVIVGFLAVIPPLQA